MLFEALAGKRPFTGEPLQVMAAKQRDDAPSLPADAPADLADLCMRLLSRDPAARPDPLQIAGAVATAPATAVPVGSADLLIGRESQQAALAASLADLRRTRMPVPVFIKGRSGEGKTSLAESFLGPLRKDGTLVVMSGRCYDRESVPFKALDTLIDALTSHLRSLPPAEAALLLPDDIGLLAEVFPVVRRCEVVAKAPRARMDALDQQQVRQRAFAALRLLLERIGERTPLVWFIDDLQWGDVDSAGALFEILRPPAAPPVLFLGSFRSDEADESPFLTEWAARQQQNGVDFGDRSVSVGPLSLEEAAQLVVNVVGRDTPAVRQRAVPFHAQTGGNPFLLTEVAGCFDPDADAFHATDIHGVLTRKLAQLPPEAGPLLDAVSVSGQAVDLAEAAVAAGLSESPEDALARMRNVRLLRIVGSKVDTYHDRIRYAVLDRMNDASRRLLHRSLAESIIRTAGGLSEEEIAALVEGRDPTAKRESLARVYDLAYHFDAAGESRPALAYSLVAARQARDQFALDVAVQQYAIAERNAAAGTARVKLLIARSLADGFIVMGRFDESRQRLDIACGLAKDPYDIADIWGIRGELHFKLGEIGNSIECFHSGIRTLGIHVPRTFVGYVWGVAKQTIVQAFHSCVPFVLHRGSPDASSDLCNHLLARLEWALYSHNALKLVWASLVGLNRAERLPRSKALSVNYVVHGNDMAVLGWHRRADRFYQSAVKLSEELNDRWGATLARSHWGLGKLGAADYRRTLELCIPATAEMAKLNDVFEYHAALMFTSIAHYGLGDLASAFKVAKVLFDSCVRVNDNYVGTWAAFQVARCTRGAAEVDVLYNCVHVLPGNTLSKVNSLTALAYFHLHRGRTEEAIHLLDEALSACIRTAYLVSFNSNVPNEAAAAHRLHVHHLESSGADSRRACRRWMRMAKWANRVSWLISPERPYALRELSLAYEHRGRIRKAWKLARKSVAVAEKQKAKYELAQSLLVQGRLGKQLGYLEAEQQMRDGQAEIDRIEGELDAVLNARPE